MNINVPPTKFCFAKSICLVDVNVSVVGIQYTIYFFSFFFHVVKFVCKTRFKERKRQVKNDKNLQNCNHNLDMSNKSISEELNSGLVAGVATHDGKECEGIPDSENKKKNKRKKKKKKKVETSDIDPHGCDAKAENTGPLPKSFENDQGEDGNELHSSNKGTPIEEGEEVVPAPREASGGKKRKKKKKKKSKESETSMDYEEDPNANNSLKEN